MFCYQCEQTAQGTGCTKIGVCGKPHDVASLQDLLAYALKGLALYAVEGRKHGIVDTEANSFTVEALFSTLTNVNFDPDKFLSFINRGVDLRERLKKKVGDAGGKTNFGSGPADFEPAGTLEALVEQGEAVGLKAYPTSDPDIMSLMHTVLFGLKGISAYADHAQILGQTDDAVFAFVHEALAATLDSSLNLNDWVALALKCGETNLRIMELLDAGNTSKYGHPVPTSVPLGHKKGKAILLSGHDLRDLEDILKASQGKNIFVYTHGEMIATHGYPKLKEKYPHFYGQFGTAWQKQIKEFPDFPGAILMTTNCLQRPQKSYADNLFTAGMVGWPGIPHIKDRDFSPVIEKALSMEGFPADEDNGSVMVGFARNAVMQVADKVIEAVKDKALRHIFLVGGCDGAKPERNYYTQLVEQIPEDCVVLTLACGKYKFFNKELGDLGGIPRLLDMGQCNDAYSAIQVALALAEAFNCGVNELPLSLVLSWYEQKAVAILLTLLHLGIKDIRLGPSLPAFITPKVLDVLVENYNIMPIARPEQDLKAILG